MPEKWTRAVRYSLVSIVSILISQAVLVLAFGIGHLPARTSNVLACIVATGPSYYLNRNWAWGRRGKSQQWKEVVPFWALAFLGLAFSTWATDAASAFARQSDVSHLGATTIVALAALAAFGSLWIGKFVVLNAVLFTDRRDERIDVSSQSPSLRAEVSTCADGCPPSGFN
jgi:putative flippase GtrA